MGLTKSKHIYQKNLTVKNVLRFMCKVCIPSNDKECWIWNASKDEHGYGLIFFNGRSIKATRLCWVLFNGDFDETLFVCHKCDNRICVNPNHLFLGSAKDNCIDMVKKGRHSNPPVHFGAKHHKAKLDPDKVKEIREMRKNGKTLQSIADLYGVHVSTVFNTCSKRKWKSVL